MQIFSAIKRISWFFGMVLTTHKITHMLYPANIYLFKVNNRNTRKRCEICSKLTIKTPEKRQRRRSRVFIVNFEHTLHLFLMILLLTLNKFYLLQKGN